MVALKASARPIHTPDHTNASFTFTSWASRWNAPRSMASIASTNAVKPIHNHIEPNIYTSWWRGKKTRPPRLDSRGGLAKGSICFNRPRDLQGLRIDDRSTRHRGWLLPNQSLLSHIQR